MKILLCVKLIVPASATLSARGIFLHKHNTCEERTSWLCATQSTEWGSHQRAKSTLLEEKVLYRTLKGSISATYLEPLKGSIHS